MSLITIDWTDDKKHKVLDLIEKYIRKHEVTSGEQVMQRDDPYVEAVDVMSNIIDITAKTVEEFHEVKEEYEKLPEYFIKWLTDENDLVLDPFMGSGTTAIACIKNNRNYIGFENNEKYIDMANNRISEFSAPIKNTKFLTQQQQKQLQKKSTLASEVYESTEMSPENILPILISVDSFHPLWHEWCAISEHVASFEFRRSPGRNMYFLVKNEYDGKNLGVIDVAADFISLGERDKYIGWSKEDRMKRNRNIANISICVPTRMFGYNMSGGKLLALLAISNEVIKKWEEKYGDKLAGITVTSLYGRGTQYNRLKYFKYLGVTKGQGSNQIPDETYRMLRKAVVEQDGEIPSGEFTKGKNSRMSIIRRGCKILGLKSSDLTTHGKQRGIYWADLSNNTRDFLCQKTDSLEYYNLSKEYLVSYWKETWAYRRLKNLENSNKILIKKTFF